jgi:hypothetical protein
MRKLFQSFESEKVRYLLISGQASILYGAATFSEDVDIWIDPTAANARRLLQALARCGATVYKLTPPLTRENFTRGHGFHFLVPTGRPPVYLDVMGRPPRVGAFADARRRSRRIEADWGPVPVVSPEDLVKLKLTQRLADYDVISRLVRIQVDATARDAPVRRAKVRWGLRNTFDAGDRARWSQELGRKVGLEACRRQVTRDLVASQRKDTLYWRRVIADLKRLYHGGGLIPVGTPVAELLSTP